MASAYYKVDVVLNSQAVSVGLPSPQSVSVTLPSVGPQGLQGLQGEIGPIGPIGPQGEQGIQGEVGPVGLIGAEGPKGDKGDKGDVGDVGPVGPTGPAGAKGDKGDKGDTGDVGPTGPQGPTIADENAPATNNTLWQIRATAFTAVSGGRYVANGTFSVTNPASGNDGELFQVVVASGTVTINSVAYGASRWPVTVARISGSWTTLANTLTENLTLNGTNSTAPNQSASSDSSLMTRALVDARFAPLAQYAVTTASIGSANNDVLTDRLTLSISATGDYLLNYGFRLTGALPQFRLNFTGTADREACAAFTSNGDAGPSYRATIINRTFNSVYNSSGMAKFRVTATGTLSIQHAQITSSGSACDLQAGAFLHLTKIA